jgi:hypothetical protein
MNHGLASRKSSSSICDVCSDFVPIELLEVAAVGSLFLSPVQLQVAEELVLV